MKGLKHLTLQKQVQLVKNRIAVDNSISNRNYFYWNWVLSFTLLNRDICLNRVIKSTLGNIGKLSKWALPHLEKDCKLGCSPIIQLHKLWQNTELAWDCWQLPIWHSLRPRLKSLQKNGQKLSISIVRSISWQEDFVAVIILSDIFICLQIGAGMPREWC